MSHQAPLRCESCGSVIEKKPGAKTPKYCPRCRNIKQEEYKQKLQADRKRKVRGR